MKRASAKIRAQGIVDIPRDVFPTVARKRERKQLTANLQVQPREDIITLSTCKVSVDT